MLTYSNCPLMNVALISETVTGSQVAGEAGGGAALS